MSAIDLNSKLLPEGDYLKMCNDMKDIYKVIPRPTSPEAALPRVRIPRQAQRVLYSDSDTEDDNEVNEYALRPLGDMRNEMEQVNINIAIASREVRTIESRLRYLKIKQRVTATIRKDAVRERAQQLGFRLREHTVEELRAKGHNIPDERSFYKNYLERQNLITTELITDLRDDLVELKRHHGQLETRRGELHFAIYGQPLR